jgi:ABC-2 type transport system ATP-binding protein
MIHAEGLTRHFGSGKATVEAVRGVDLEVTAGELVAFLGPNGAGKTTTLRMLTTLLGPTAGTAMVAGHDIHREQAAVRQRIGYVGQGNGAGHNQRVGDELVSQGRSYGMSRADSRARAAEVMEQLDLGALRDRKVMTLSGGQKRRLDVAIGIMHRPELLFLDEPTTGLDPHSRANLWEHILQLRADVGTTIFLTTHYLDEADAMAERVLVMDHGRVIAEGTSEQLKADLGGDRVTVSVAREADADRVVAIAAQVAAVHAASRPSQRQVELRVTRGDLALAPLVLALAEASVQVVGVDLQRPTLDDVFLSLTGRSLREGGREVPVADAASGAPSATLSPATDLVSEGAAV